MLQGIAQFANSDYAIAVSGIAGPTGGTKEKPVGTIYLGILNQNSTIIEQWFFKGNRDFIQNQATSSSIALLKKNL